ncbi:hypothetical protein QWZ06_09020 [Chryseobacterium tructae]|uniref:Uncharacterized protein n=1 Tax=Chryseobacterium tructae TaxID=1037380 RepID=A0ABV7XXX5_9FLAO|nr:hypothetical protein [Chryseobacterium tructae]MDN3692399.1 hypothetical protein [Chryseobacterium tructae]
MIYPKPYIAIFILITFLFSCHEKTKKTSEPAFKKEIIKLDGYTKENYNKQYTYYWVAKDTSDLKFTLYERKSDSTVLWTINHEKQIDFSVLLDSLNNAIPEIRKDFDLYKINSLVFEQPLYYPDLNRALTTSYQKKFGETPINYPKLNEFLLSAAITPQLNTFLKPLHKKVKNYSMEKFHLQGKEQIIKYYPHMNFDNYPSFTLSGIGIYVHLEEL